jgi:short-chain fatty acids transporter
VNGIAALLGAVWIVKAFGAKGLGAINLDLVNLLFLTLGLVFHGTPASFLRAAEEGGRHVWGIVVQFPFYAGIFGILKYSGLQDVLAGWFARVATAETYPFVILWYSGFLNYIVPSGGSKWAIEGPYIVQAAQTIGASTNFTVLAYAWGDMLTDVIQPFWAIPLLAIAGLRFRDIMGFALVFFGAYAALLSAAFLLLALG